MEWYIIIGLIVIFGIVAVFIYKKAYKIGMQELLSLFLASGYEMKVKAFKVQNQFVKKGGVVFVGDSITQDYPIHDFFPSLHAYNRGIGGDTTMGLVKRLDESIFDLEPKMIVLQIGTNDFGVLSETPEDVAQRIQDMIKAVHERLPKTKILLVSVYPINETLGQRQSGNRNNTNINILNQLIKETSGVTYVDVHQELLDADGRLKVALTYDGLHLNAEGYAVVTDCLNPLIDAR